MLLIEKHTQASLAQDMPSSAVEGQLQQLKAALKASDKECDVLREAVAAQDAEMRQLRQDIQTLEEASVSSSSADASKVRLLHQHSQPDAANEVQWTGMI